MPNREPGHFDGNGDVDNTRVTSLCDAGIDAMDRWSDEKGGGAGYSANEAIDALSMNICVVTQRSPDDATTAYLANRAIEFIMRNCGVDPAFLLAFRAVERANSLERIQPEGSA